MSLWVEVGVLLVHVPHLVIERGESLLLQLLKQLLSLPRVGVIVVRIVILVLLLLLLRVLERLLVLILLLVKRLASKLVSRVISISTSEKLICVLLIHRFSRVRLA